MKWWSNLIELTNYIFCRRRLGKDKTDNETETNNTNKFFLAKKRKHDKDMQNYKKVKLDLEQSITTLIRAPSKEIVQFMDNFNKISRSYTLNRISIKPDQFVEVPCEELTLNEDNVDDVKNSNVIRHLDFINDKILNNRTSHKSLMKYVEANDLEENFKSLQEFIVEKTKRNNFPIIDYINFKRFHDIINGIVKAFNTKEINIQIDSILKLQDTQWLNDEVINSYGKLIMKRQSESETSYPMTYIFSTFFYEKLKNLLMRNEGNVYLKMKRFWEKKSGPKLNLFNYQNILIPINLTNFHWSLISLNLHKRSFTYYDSMCLDTEFAYSIMEELANLFQDYLKENKDDDSNKKLSTSFTSSDINVLLGNHPSSSDSSSDSSNKRQNLNFSMRVIEVPQQENSYDCGVFLCKFMDYISRGEELDFSQDDMAYFRLLIGIELINERLFTY